MLECVYSNRPLVYRVFILESNNLESFYLLSAWSDLSSHISLNWKIEENVFNFIFQLKSEKLLPDQIWHFSGSIASDRISVFEQNYEEEILEGTYHIFSLNIEFIYKTVID